MPIDFAYAQARAQARHGDRLSPAAWGLLESSVGLAQYLHAVRGTALAPRVQHFTANSSPHAIERSLRREWRAEVDNAVHWAPQRWRDSIAWTARLPELPAIAHLRDGGEVLAWMQDDPALSAFALPEQDARLHAIDESALGRARGADGGDLVARWLERWQALLPDAETGDASLLEFVDLLLSLRQALEEVMLVGKAARDLAEVFERRVIRLMRTRIRQPVIIFCHLTLTALELWRLRGGLMRRALFNDVAMERVA